MIIRPGKGEQTYDNEMIVFFEISSYLSKTTLQSSALRKDFIWDAIYEEYTVKPNSMIRC